MGTLTPQIKEAVKKAKAGQVEFRPDKNGIVNVGVAKVSFSIDKIIDNINAFINAVKQLKPTSSKGEYIKKILPVFNYGGFIFGES